MFSKKKFEIESSSESEEGIPSTDDKDLEDQDPGLFYTWQSIFERCEGRKVCWMHRVLQMMP